MWNRRKERVYKCAFINLLVFFNKRMALSRLHAFQQFGYSSIPKANWYSASILHNFGINSIFNEKVLCPAVNRAWSTMAYHTFIAENAARKASKIDNGRRKAWFGTHISLDQKHCYSSTCILQIRDQKIRLNRSFFESQGLWAELFDHSRI